MTRFTGGVAGSREFAACGPGRALSFAGKVSRIQYEAFAGMWHRRRGVGCSLFLLLRDRIEGDLTFGFPASKGTKPGRRGSTYEAVGRRRSFGNIRSRNEDSGAATRGASAAGERLAAVGWRRRPHERVENRYHIHIPVGERTNQQKAQDIAREDVGQGSATDERDVGRDKYRYHRLSFDDQKTPVVVGANDTRAPDDR